MFKILRVLLIVSIVLTVFSGAASAFDKVVVKKVDVDVDGKVTSLNTAKTTVGQVLADLSIKLAKDDIVTPSVDTEITKGMTIKVQKSFMVTINVDGSPMYLRVPHGEIKTAKQRIEEALKTETVLVGAKETDPMIPNMTLELATNHVETSEEKSTIPFGVVYVENPELDEGVETVLEEGSPGIAITTYENRYEGGKVVEKTVVDTRVELEKKDRVIEKGTKLLKPVVPDVPEMKLVYTKVMTLNATAYTTDRGDSGPRTATGEKARVGLVAVDPKVIPLGTMLYVENYGVCRAADTGGAIKGNKIDLFFDTYNECINFGRRNITVYVLEATRDEIYAVLDVSDIEHEIELEAAEEAKAAKAA